MIILYAIPENDSRAARLRDILSEEGIAHRYVGTDAAGHTLGELFAGDDTPKPHAAADLPEDPGIIFNAADIDRDEAAKFLDKLVDNGPKADDDAIAASTWAAAVKDAGVFKIGGVQTSTLFSLLNEKDGQTRGFDAGIAQLLSNYILGENKVEITQVTSDTRESVLQNGQVDAVFATYTITDERKKLVSFAGPYYYTQQAILVLADNDDIKSVDDLADKNVAVQSGSNGPAILEEFAPKASQQEFKTDEEARQALQQGRVDAYVIDNNMQQSALVREPGKYKIAGKPFGSKEPYGIGLPLDSDGVAFVNDFLKKIEDDGTWTELWQICIGDRTGDTNVPELPEIGA